MSQVFAPAVEGVILIAVVYALSYFGAFALGYQAAKAFWKWWRA